MPELPDVEVFRRRLAATSLHRRIERVRVLDGRLLHDVDERTLDRTLRGRSLEATHRHGKHLVVDVSDDGVLVLHFGMTGHLATGEGDPPALPHLRLEVDFTDGHHLLLVDQRRLGQVTLADSLDEYVDRRGLGPDALSLRPAELRDLLQRSRGGVKATLMDQDKVAGLGNIYSDEVLFQARIDPRAPARQLDDAAYRRLHRALRHVATVAVERGADPGRMPRTWLLPNREEGAPCPRGTGTVQKFRSGGRSGYWCSECQRA